MMHVGGRCRDLEMAFRLYGFPSQVENIKQFPNMLGGIENLKNTNQNVLIANLCRILSPFFTTGLLNRFPVVFFMLQLI